MYRLALLLALLPSLALADEVLVKGLERGKEYRLSVAADGSVSVVPLRVVTVGGDPVPNPDPPPPNPTAFEAEVEKQTKAVLAAGGTVTTGAALSSAYSLVSDGVGKGTIDHTRCLEAINQATTYVLTNSADGPKWEIWRRNMADALDVLRAQGALRTKAEYAAALKSVAAGMDRATGFKGNPAAIAKLTLANLATVDRRALGILDNIDFKKLWEFVQFLIKLFELFAPAM